MSKKLANTHVSAGISKKIKL